MANPEVFDYLEKHGGAAFPCEGGVDSGLYSDPGMTLRDWFAGQVLSGMIDSTYSFDHRASWARTEALDRASWAYMQADAMLAARTEGE